jgi:hypothetical protein
MIKFKVFYAELYTDLSERFWKAIDNSDLVFGKDKELGYREIFKNPTDRELRDIQDDIGYACILTSDQIAICFSNRVMHSDVMKAFKLSKDDCVTLRIEQTGVRAIRVETSDTMQGSKFKDEKELEEYIKNHAFLSRYKIRAIDAESGIY